MKKTPHTVAVTGAAGFIGRNVVDFLKGVPGCRVVAAGRDEQRLRSLDVEYAVLDINERPADCFDLLGRPGTLIHLAWDGLDNYRSPVHIERNLMSGYNFLKDMIKGGLSNLAVAGTCYEYGLQQGCLREGVPAAPTLPYAIAKDALRRVIEVLQAKHEFRFCWARFFFLYGEGQNPRSLIPRLDAAIASGAASFDMSGGEQLRDYLHVGQAARLLAKVALQKEHEGIFNICSGHPISVLRLVEERISQKKGKIRLNPGALPYPDYEPMAYWGDTGRLEMAVGAFDEEFYGLSRCPVNISPQERCAIDARK